MLRRGSRSPRPDIICKFIDLSEVDAWGLPSRFPENTEWSQMQVGIGSCRLSGTPTAEPLLITSVSPDIPDMPALERRQGGRGSGSIPR